MDRGGITSRTVDTIHDAMRSTELVFSRDVRERLHRASAAIFRLNTPAARGTTHYKQDIIGLRNELQTLLTRWAKKEHSSQPSDGRRSEPRQSLAAANDVCVAPDVQAFFCRRRHQPRRVKF
jgi:hypothetical protein